MLDKRSTESDWEPVDELGDGDKADAKAESANPSQVGDEVQPGHLGRSLELWDKSKVIGRTGPSWAVINQSVICLPNAVESPKKRLTTAMSFT